jgi:hypothetical protein
MPVITVPATTTIMMLAVHAAATRRRRGQGGSPSQGMPILVAGIHPIRHAAQH